MLVLVLLPAMASMPLTFTSNLLLLFVEPMYTVVPLSLSNEFPPLVDDVNLTT